MGGLTLHLHTDTELQMVASKTLPLFLNPKPRAQKLTRPKSVLLLCCAKKTLQQDQ